MSKRKKEKNNNNPKPNNNENLSDIFGLLQLIKVTQYRQNQCSANYAFNSARNSNAVGLLAALHNFPLSDTKGLIRLRTLSFSVKVAVIENCWLA